MGALLIIIIVAIIIFLVAKALNRKGSKKPPSNRRERESMMIRVSGTANASSSRRKLVDPDEVWVPANRSIAVAGYSIHHGMLYFGEYLQSAGGYTDPDPALINPRLEVDRMRPNSTGDGMGYWPSYSSINPSSRAAYLEWLAGGCSDPSCYIGYVFLYFYGLERRALSDAATSVAAQGETDAIRLEVARLLMIYQSNSSFRNYASEFLEVFRLRQSASRFYEQEPPLERSGYALPISVRAALGQLAVDGKPIPPDWALAWVMLHPDARLRTPAKRCSEEFRSLFKIRYAERYDEGLRVAPNKTKVNWEYRAASSSFQSSIKIIFGDLPDVSILHGPLNKLVEIADQCADELQPFSRFIARAGADRQGIAAFALLPSELSGHAKNPEVSKLKDWIGERSKGAEIVQVPTAELINQLPDANEDSLSIKEATLLSQIFEKLGYGLEPDPRFGGPAFKRGGKAMLFQLGMDAPKAPSPQYSASTALVHVGIAVAQADGMIAASEREYLLSNIEATMHLSDGERRRLSAHTTWLVNSEVGLSGLRKRIEMLSNQQKQALAAFSIGVATADGKVEPEEIKTLTRLYPMLGLLPDDVYTHLHALMSATPASISEGPVTVQLGQQAKTGFSIPPTEAIKRKMNDGVILDMKAVRTKLKETAEVSAFLSTIFVEDLSLPPEHPPSAGVRIGTLDAAHSQLLRLLVNNKELNRVEFEQMAAELGLMPDGALDVINDAAFEISNRILCEGDDPIFVDVDVAKEMVA